MDKVRRPRGRNLRLPMTRRQTTARKTGSKEGWRPVRGIEPGKEGSKKRNKLTIRGREGSVQLKNKGKENQGRKR